MQIRRRRRRGHRPKTGSRRSQHAQQGHLRSILPRQRSSPQTYALRLLGPCSQGIARTRIALPSASIGDVGPRREGCQVRFDVQPKNLNSMTLILKQLLLLFVFWYYLLVSGQTSYLSTQMCLL
ncbi:hypothetical protein L5515_007201 [Caenorhabditis briggsae]|uniref:Uncharacterized protein n=1 Tax=Caenorhabditis briggsae TaxID=6238 RepID=A0AAE9JKI6_CAEBR|nr:hypothetical protein L5515_007201 [Caenorhabditis briggsae]